MIGRLVGRVVEEDADGSVVLDVSGVGYEVDVPLGTLGRAPRSADGALTLFVHTHVREDAFVLFGFASKEDRAAFRTLIAVSNVGPKMAMSVLGSLSVAELAAAVARSDVKKLVGIPGIGKKTAERLVLELKDKLVPPTHAAPANVATPPSTPTAKGELLHGALTRMGYRPSEADRAVAALAPRTEDAPLAELVREALAVLSK